MKNQKGITMLTLIITIIVMLILAGVSISTVVGDESVIIKSKQAVLATKEAIALEEVQLAWAGLETDYWLEDHGLAKKIYFTANNFNRYVKTTGSIKSFTYIPGDISYGVYYSNADDDTYDFEINTKGHLDDSLEITTEFCTIKFYNEDGTLLYSSVTVSKDTDIVYTGAVPIKTSTTDYTYEFAGWVTTKGGSEFADFNNIQTSFSVYASFNAIPTCFVAGTKVLTENGLMNIEDIKKGMFVYSKNLVTGQIELKKVTETFENIAIKNMATITINGNDVVSTDGHKYYVIDKGWTKAKELLENDVLIDNNNNEISIDNIQINENSKEIKVYNLEVQDNHNYFVGEDSILVHNKLSPTEEEIGGC